MDSLSILMKYSAGAAQKQTSGSSNSSNTLDVLSRYGKGLSVAPVSQFTGEKQQNDGGFFGGLGYLGEKIGLGFLSGIEGIWDYTAGGLAKLFGADDWAEQQFSNDWVNYNHADEWFNPSKGWQVAGDVAGGIGTSLPALAGVAAAAAIAYFSGGSLSGVSAGIISGVIAGLGAAGNATKQAYRQTGELGGKEFGYGFLSGLTEGAVEGLSAGIGAGTGAIAKNITKSFGKEVAKSAARETAKATGKTLAKEAGKQILLGFVGEAFEEGLSEFLDPYWKRMTYDPSAKNATIQEIGYAALIGGLSGAIMSGVDVSVRSTVSTVRGSNIVNNGKAADVITTAENIVGSDAYTDQYESFQNVKSLLTELQTSMEKTGGEIRTLKQKTLLGYLERANTFVVFEPMIQRNAARIVTSAEAVAERLTKYGYKDANGNPIVFTPEQIRSGFDVNNPKTFAEALKKNNVLRTLAVIDTTGQLYMDTKAFEQATLRGEALSSQVDLNRFIETATQEELDSVAERLEIADWQGLTNEQFKEKIVAFSQNGGVETYQTEQTKKAELRAAAEAVSPEKAKKRIPKSFTTKNDGVVRYSQNGVDMAVIKDGDAYRIFDYEKGRLSKAMTLEQLNSELAKIKEGLESELTRLQESQTETRERQEAAEIDAYAAENISAYSKLSDANKSLVRGVIRQARAAGISDADALSYARVSTKAGVNISFDKQAKVGDAEVLLVGKNTETGAPVYADGVYLAQTNTIYVNPEAKRSHERLLIHELTHAIYRGKGGSVILMQGVEKMSAEEKEAIVKRYRAAGHGSAVELIDEINAHFAEGQLTNKKLLQRLTEDAPTIKQRILAFFKKSAAAYSEDERLTGAAKKLYKQYKKLFDSFAEENQGNNAFEAQVDTAEDSRLALSDAIKTLGEYDDARKRHIESREYDTISRDYNEIAEFIRTAESGNPVRRLHIGTISDATAKLVAEKTGVDIKNYDFVLASNYIAHIFDRHGKTETEAPRGQKAVTYENIENILETVISPDDVSQVSDNSGTALRFEKHLDGRNVAITITSTKKSTLTLKSAWIINESGGRTPSANASAFAGTSETSGRSSTFNSISENGENVNPKGKKDVRYALSIDGENVTVEGEQTENLVALHNLSEDSLLRVLDLGGFPMPSIAVTRTDLPHENYGDITVVFGRRTVDPKANSRNVVYDRDAWTPTAPKTDVKLNDAAVDTLIGDLKKLVGGNETFRHRIDSFFDGNYRSNSGEYIVSEYDYTKQRIGEKAIENDGILAAYLQEKGKDVEPVYREDTLYLGNTPFTREEARYLLDYVGISKARETVTPEQRKEILDKYVRYMVSKSLRKFQRFKPETTFESLYEASKGDYGDGHVSQLLFMADDFFNENRPKTVYDSYATKDKLRSQIEDVNDFYSWVWEKIENTFEKKGIDNDSDVFDRSGKRRSFEQRHYTYTLNNVVRAMSKGVQEGKATLGMSAGALAAKLSTQFDSIESIREAKKYLSLVSDEEMDAFKDKTYEMYDEIVTEIAGSTGSFLSDSSRRDDVGDILGKCASVRPLTVENIKKTFDDETRGYKLNYKFNDEIAEKALTLFESLRRTPTTYFEAKPRRAVGLDEIKMVLVPEKTSLDLITRLDENGVPYQLYSGEEGARSEIIEKLDGVRFALPETDSDGIELTVQQREYFNDSKVVDEQGRLKVVYHGTRSVFTQFSRDRNYFTDSQEVADSYAPAKIKMTGYLDIKKPFIIDAKGERWSRIPVTAKFKKLLDRYGGSTFYEDGKLRTSTADIAATIMDLVDDGKADYDGIIIKNVEDVGQYWTTKSHIVANDYIVFSSEQFKLTTNENPTTNPDVRYALSETDSDGERLSAQQIEFFKNSAVVDEDGKLLPVYHSTNNYEEIDTWNEARRSWDTKYTPFTEFKKTYSEQVGHFFGKDINNAGGYGNRIYKVYLNLINPLIIDCKGSSYSDIAFNGKHKDTYEWAAYAKKEGYDGVIFKNIRDGVDYGAMQDATDEYVAFRSSQIKLTTNKTPTTNRDIRFALPDDTDEGSMGGYSRGQRAKFAANNTALKVYSRADAEAVINEIMEERFIFEDDGQYGEISARTRDEVVNYLFRKLNTVKEGYRIPVALNIADYLIEHATIVDMYADGVASEAIQELQVYRSFMHRIDLSGIQKEIEYTFDKRNGINMVWGAPKGKGIAPDTLGMELEEYGIFLKGDNEADLFIQLVERYRKARDLVAEGVKKQTLLDVGSKKKLEELRQKIARDILIAYDERGTQSKYGKLVEKYTAQIDSLKQQVKNNRRDNAMRNRIIDDAKYLREIAEKRSYVSADVFNAPELTAWLKLLGRLQFRSDLRKTGVRQILLDYGKFYNTENPLLYDADPNLTYIDNNVLDALALIRQNENSTKELSFEELQAAQVIMASAKHLFQNYDQMILEGRKVRISEVAAQGNEILLRSKNHVGRGFFNGIYGVFNKIVEPRVVIKSLENYDPRGILTRAYSEITKGETEAGVLYIRLVENFDTFFAKNKSYEKRLTSEYVTVGGKRLTVGQAISLYELSKREQARAGLFEAGFSFVDEKGAKQSVTISQSDIDALAQTFTETDKQFIAVVEEFFNVRSKQVKTEADLEILGYTNASEDFYFPIKRDSGTIAKNITDARDIMADWANVYNFSFNKDVKKGAANKLFITDVYSVVTRHAQQLSTYAKLTVPLKNFSQIYSRNIGTKTNVITIRNTINERVWGGAENYLRKLFSDIQGKTTSSSFIEKLRGAYAKYQLGANAKVIVSQVTSYPTAAILLDVDCLARGAVMKTNYAAMDEYCGFAKVRNYEKGIVKAEGVIDTVGKLGDLFTKPIQWTDRLTIGKLWNACQVQVQKTNGYKIGTVENMTAAGVLLEEVTRLTQPNYSNSERSELMRSDSDIVRSFTMFTSVPLKQLSRLVESVGEFTALRQMIRSGDTSVEVAERYKVAKRKLGRTIAAITVANMFYVLVGQFFKWLFDKDRKDKDGNEISFVKDLLNDFVSTTVGMLPIVRDIYNFFANDYEFNNFAYETVNNVLTASKELFEMASKAASGEDMSKSDFGKPLRDSLYAIGQITGLPFRNINNQISGLVKHFDPSAAYKYNSMFYNAQYSKDIKKALEKGDTELANTIMSMLLNESRTGDLNDAAGGKLTELYGKGYTVLPRTVGNSITYNGETVPMTEQQRKQFVSICSQANGYIEKMIASPRFEKLPEDRQAKAIKSVYDAYYYQAVSDLLGTDANNTLGDLSQYIALDKLAIAFSELSEITSDVDKSGNVINGSKKKKTIAYLLKQNLTDGERLLILYYRGYTILDGDFKGYTKKRARTVLLKYILGLKATAAQKAQIASECGFTAKNGKIVRSSV